MLKISREEYKILKSLDDKWKWIARDENSRKSTFPNELWLYEYKPKRIRIDWLGEGGATKRFDYDNLFQFIKHKDAEPYNIAELIEEYEYSAEHVSHVVNERVKALGNAWRESEETEVKKDIEWLKNEVNELPLKPLGFSVLKQREEFAVNKDDVLELINQLDEPEVLSQEWIDEHKKSYTMEDSVEISDLQNLLVPKQEEVNQSYKDGYEKGKQHTFYKGYLEGITDKGSEPETVVDVVTTFWKSYERLKEVMSMEVEELEE